MNKILGPDCSFQWHSWTAQSWRPQCEQSHLKTNSINIRKKLKSTYFYLLSKQKLKHGHDQWNSVNDKKELVDSKETVRGYTSMLTQQPSCELLSMISFITYILPRKFIERSRTPCTWWFSRDWRLSRQSSWSGRRPPCTWTRSPSPWPPPFYDSCPCRRLQSHSQRLWI